VKVAMFVYADVTHDARVLREAGSLAAAGHEVTVVARPRADGTGGGPERRDGFTIVRVPIPDGWRLPWRILGLPARLAARLVDRIRGGRSAEETLTWLVLWRFAILGWARVAAAAAGPADVYHGHDLSGLPAALASRRRARVGRIVYDSHELFLDAGANVRRPAWLRRRFARLEGAWAGEAAAVVTVNDALAAELARRYELPRVLAVHNCPPRWQPPAVPDPRLRAAIGCAADTPVALYHGSFAPHRGLEQLADALLEPGMEQVHAVDLGFGGQRDALEALAREPRFGGRLHVLPPVPPEDVVGWVSGADVDVLAIQPSTLNHVLSTPNKLFEALAAGVPVVASDFDGLRAIVVNDPDGPLGVVCDPADPAAIAAAIRSIVEAPAEERDALRGRCLAAAHRRWNWESESAKLVELYRTLGPGSAA
jgi:glycosyltransferase involved in cell wall biosynthesis